MEVKDCTKLTKTWEIESFKTVVCGNPSEGNYDAKFEKDGKTLIEKKLVATPKSVDYEGYSFHRACYRMFK